MYTYANINQTCGGGGGGGGSAHDFIDETSINPARRG